jgi:hypothetical protein
MRYGSGRVNNPLTKKLKPFRPIADRVCVERHTEPTWIKPAGRRTCKP